MVSFSQITKLSVFFPLIVQEGEEIDFRRRADSFSPGRGNEGFSVLSFKDGKHVTAKIWIWYLISLSQCFRSRVDFYKSKNESLKMWNSKKHVSEKKNIFCLNVNNITTAAKQVRLLLLLKKSSTKNRNTVQWLNDTIVSLTSHCAPDTPDGISPAGTSPHKHWEQQTHTDMVRKKTEQ